MKQEPSFFEGKEPVLIDIAKRLRDALRLESIFTAAGVDYGVEADEYRGGVLFRAVRAGALLLRAAGGGGRGARSDAAERLQAAGGGGGVKVWGRMASCAAVGYRRQSGEPRPVRGGDSRRVGEPYCDSGSYRMLFFQFAVQSDQSGRSESSGILIVDGVLISEPLTASTV